MQILKWTAKSETMTKKSNFFGKHLIFMGGTTYQTIQSGGGPLCKMGQPTMQLGNLDTGNAASCPQGIQPTNLHPMTGGLDVPTPAPPHVSPRVGVARTPLLPTAMVALRRLHAVLALLLGVQAKDIARHQMLETETVNALNKIHPPDLKITSGSDNLEDRQGYYWLPDTHFVQKQVSKNTK